MTGLHKKPRTAQTPKAAAPATTKVVPVGGAKNGKTRTIPIVKPPRFYPADDVPVPKKSRKSPGAIKLRASITPGTVVILLSGRFRGKRVVVLKQLESGLLLVTGPHKINGVPLRRVNQAYVIATSTKVDISSVTIDEKFNDAYFKTHKEAKAKATAAELLEQAKQKPEINPARAADQKTLDAQLLKVVAKTPLLKAYLKTPFALSKGQYPHALKF
eukprot:jgi/Hompol1/1045/HPOL_004601-RA